MIATHDSQLLNSRTVAYTITLPNGEQFLCPNKHSAAETADARGGVVAPLSRFQLSPSLQGQYLWRSRTSAPWAAWKPWGTGSAAIVEGDPADDDCVIADVPETVARDVERLPVVASDYAEELAIELTEGTQVPQSFARETLKGVLLAALPSTRPQLPYMDDLHTRYYSILLSESAGAGKGVSYNRAMRVLNAARLRCPKWTALQAIAPINGMSFGSPEFAVQKLGGVKASAKPGRGASKGTVVSASNVNAPGTNLVEDDLAWLPGAVSEMPRHLVHYDEGLQLLKKDSKQSGSSGLITMFTSLFEFNSAETGSFKNGEARVENANVSLDLHFVRSTFEEHFAGTGATSDGFLSRCVLTSDKANTVHGDWRVTDAANVDRLVKKLEECAGRKELPITPDADAARLSFLQELRAWDKSKSGRLEFLFNQDLYFRGMYSADGAIDSSQVARAAAWTRLQLKARLAIWPIDSGADKREAMERLILGALKGGRQYTRRDLHKAANVGRPGSGGATVFEFTLRALIGVGVVVELGKNRKGSAVYALTE